MDKESVDLTCHGFLFFYRPASLPARPPSNAPHLAKRYIILTFNRFAVLALKICDVFRLELAIRGVFAGNLFDLGAAASAALFEQNGAAFSATRDALAPRPWVVDDLESILTALTAESTMSPRASNYRHALLFVDNGAHHACLLLRRRRSCISCMRSTFFMDADGIILFVVDFLLELLSELTDLLFCFCSAVCFSTFVMKLEVMLCSACCLLPENF